MSFYITNKIITAKMAHTLKENINAIYSTNSFMLEIPTNPSSVISHKISLYLNRNYSFTKKSLTIINFTLVFFKMIFSGRRLDIDGQTIFFKPGEKFCICAEFDKTSNDYINVHVCIPSSNEFGVFNNIEMTEKITPSKSKRIFAICKTLYETCFVTGDFPFTIKIHDESLDKGVWSISFEYRDNDLNKIYYNLLSTI